MKILMYPHDLAVGGSQMNAIELAGRLRSRGHDVTVFGRPGALCQRIADLGLQFVVSPTPRRRPSPSVTSTLGHLLQGGFDVVHAWEWPPILESALASRGTETRVVGTVMSMAVAPFIPRTLPLLVGTEQIAYLEELRGRHNVGLLEPPVDLEHNQVSHQDAQAFRSAHGVSPTETLVVTVTRLAHELKAEGLRTAIETWPQVRSGEPTRLMIVGAGPAEGEIRSLAESVNARLGRAAIILTGELLDPRPAYAAADVHLAMGGSALRSLAFGKPLVVQGERGFWRRLDPESVHDFLWGGWYGIGPDSRWGSQNLQRELSSVLDLGIEQRAVLGTFGRQLVERRFDLNRAVTALEKVYAGPDRTQPGGFGGLAETLRSTSSFGRYFVDRRIKRLLGRAPVDDFNAAVSIDRHPAQVGR